MFRSSPQWKPGMKLVAATKATRLRMPSTN